MCNPFPNNQLQTLWAMDSWDDVSDGEPMPDSSVLRYVSATFSESIYFDQCPNICFQVTNRNSNARMLLKDCIQKLIAPNYELKTSAKPKTVQSNIGCVKALAGTAFHVR